MSLPFAQAIPSALYDKFCEHCLGQGHVLVKVQGRSIISPCADCKSRAMIQQDENYANAQSRAYVCRHVYRHVYRHENDAYAESRACLDAAYKQAQNIITACADGRMAWCRPMAGWHGVGRWPDGMM